MLVTRQVALITGAGSGIGRATAQRFAQDGYALAAMDIDGDAATKVVDELGAEGFGRRLDVRDEQDVIAAVAEAHERLGRLDAVVNAAGVGGFALSTEVSLADWERILTTNLTGTFLMCREALPLLEQYAGCIVNLGSVAGLAGRAYGAAYSSSKAGVVMLTRTLAIEFGARGVRVNAVCPGGVDTPLLQNFAPPPGADPDMVSKGGLFDRLADPAEIAGAIAYLCSDEAAFMTGASMVIDGGALA